MSHAHSHDHGSHGHSHDDNDHGHSHDHGSHGHSHEDGSHGHSHDNEKVTVEDVTDDNEEEDDSKDDQTPVGTTGGRPESKAEKKAKKIMLKSGMKLFKAGARVTLKRSKDALFVIESAEVYKSGDVYVVFGEARLDDLAAQAQTGAAEQFKAPTTDAEAASAIEKMVAALGNESAAANTESEPAEISEAELAELKIQEKDIDLIMSQGKVSRAKAISLLKEGDGDVVNILMQLSSA